MSSPATGPGRPAKRSAIDCAARTVFGREGYLGASMDSIAAEAGVSKRTVYNHYENKEQLLVSVLRDSTHAVAQHQQEIIDLHLSEPTELRAALIAIGHALAAPQSGFEGHFALVQVIYAEAARLPPEAIESWRAEGPRRVRACLAERFTALAAAGLLRADDPALAASHFLQLVTFEIYDLSLHGALPLPQSEVDQQISQGVDAFLRLHGTETVGSGQSMTPAPGRARPRDEDSPHG